MGTLYGEDDTACIIIPNTHTMHADVRLHWTSCLMNKDLVSCLMFKFSGPGKFVASL